MRKDFNRFTGQLNRRLHEGRIDEVISKPYAVADVPARANAILAKQLDAHRETVMV